jgi:alkanesulfonate monooxygenase SsuD/methylene tetrahydromethanopterin reductase-like flavin-dependent oxidoreductase (luciferase family)
MKFGHFCLPTYQPEIDGSVGDYMRRWIDFLVWSEELGFDSLWANEHHFNGYGGIVPSTPLMLSALAQRTKRARIGTSVVVLPLHNPVEVAEQFAMVDLMSGGRVDLGIGRGFVSYDYQVFGIELEQGQARSTEGLEVILKAWADAPLTHYGTHFQFENVDVWPKPQQRPHPPVFVACTANPASFQWTGTHGLNLLTVAYGPGVQNLPELVTLYRNAWHVGDHPDGAWQINTHYQVVVAETSEEAKRLCVPAIQRYREAVQASQHAGARGALYPEPRTDYEYLVGEGRIISGTPDDCRQQLQAAQERVGFTSADCMFYWGGIPFDAARRSLELFAAKVMPALKSPALAPA